MGYLLLALFRQHPGDTVGGAVLRDHGQHEQYRQRTAVVHPGVAVCHPRRARDAGAGRNRAPPAEQLCAAVLGLAGARADPQFGARISYIGSKGTQLPYRRDVNQPLASTVAFNNARRPYPAFANITYSDNGANMLYSGLQAQLNRRFSHGLMFTSTWTWAKEISDTDDTGDFELNTPIENSYDRRRDRGNVYSVPRHQWMNHAIYEIPGREIWPAGGRSTCCSTWRAETGSRPCSAAPTPPTRSRRRCGPMSPAPSLPASQSPWFDPSVFTTPASGQWGNAGRGIIEGPGYVLLNAGLQKKVRLERSSFVVVASFTNVVNHLNLGEPTAGGSPLGSQTIVNNANAGRITGSHIFPPAGSPRTGQLGIRWSF